MERRANADTGKSAKLDLNSCARGRRTSVCGSNHVVFVVRLKFHSGPEAQILPAGFQLHVPLPLEPETPYADLVRTLSRPLSNHVVFVVRLKFHSGPEAQILPTLLQKCFGQKPHVSTSPHTKRIKSRLFGQGFRSTSSSEQQESTHAEVIDMKTLQIRNPHKWTRRVWTTRQNGLTGWSCKDTAGQDKSKIGGVVFFSI